MSVIKKRLIIVEEDPAAVQEVKRKLAGSPYIQICGETSRAAEVLQLVQACQPDAVVVGYTRDSEPGLVCQQIRFYFPQIVCIAVCPEREWQWEPFLRSLGVLVLAKPLQVSQLEVLVTQFPATYSAPADLPRPLQSGQGSVQSAKANRPKHFITVYGPKGGVGKTFVSRELAVYWRSQTVEGQPLKVLAVDFNLDLGTIATSLNLPRTPNLFTWVEAIDEQLSGLAKREGYDPAAVSHAQWQEYCMSLALPADEIQKYVVVHQETGLHVLTSPREIRQSFDIKDYHLYLILQALKQSEYDVILLDTAPDTTDATIQALFFAEQVVMVGNPVIDAIENIQRMLKLLREAEYPEERIQICINRLSRREMFTLEEMRAYFQLHSSKTIFSVPDDDLVKRSINSGVPLMLSSGRSAAKEALISLAQSLVPITQSGEEHRSGEQNKKAGSLLSRLFRKRSGVT
ncbi:AAA family ATPase [Brevibacillus massiliensis]|uniref:AAA family ATPase n=1 Tax=Brevibacillus massiliensis TaxID=1118054 RepID=UPI0002F83A6A|nr:AAA family ATPase [Brevibacillus massiliensis]